MTAQECPVRLAERIWTYLAADAPRCGVLHPDRLVIVYTVARRDWRVVLSGVVYVDPAHPGIDWRPRDTHTAEHWCWRQGEIPAGRVEMPRWIRTLVDRAAVEVEVLALSADDDVDLVDPEPSPDAEPQTEVVDLVAALRASVEAAKARRATGS